MTDYRIDCLQYANWSEKIFREMRVGGLDAVHVTIAYHETFRETVLNMEQWNRWFEQFPDLIFQGYTGADVRLARETGRTAIGARFMQLTYNNQSLLATGCYESYDSGLTRMGREVVAEMNRVGLVVDMSHSGEKSTLDAIEFSKRPIAITHANPYSWHAALRNKSDTVMRALGETNGMLGFSIYPHHLKDGPACTLDSFCQMIANAADVMGVDNIGIGTDLCQDQPDSIVEWMRVGRWTKGIDYGEGSASNAGFPPMPSWYKDNRDFDNFTSGLQAIGMSTEDTNKVMGSNWLRFYDDNFGSVS